MDRISFITYLQNCLFNKDIDHNLQKLIVFFFLRVWNRWRQLIIHSNICDYIKKNFSMFTIFSRSIYMLYITLCMTFIIIQGYKQLNNAQYPIILSIVIRVSMNPIHCYPRLTIIQQSIPPLCFNVYLNKH